MDSIRSSVARRLGLENVIFDAVENCNEPLTEERLFKWNKELFVGQNETYKENEKIHYEAPPAVNVKEEMTLFLKLFNTPYDKQKIPSVIKRAIAHLYFVSIHPFEDGNGRLSRAIADMALSQDECITTSHNNNQNQIKYAKICKCSQDTASRDLGKLTECGILSKSESRGKSTSYSLIF